jgi:hypothetical protein
MNVEAKIYKINAGQKAGEVVPGEVMVTKELMLQGYRATIVLSTLVACGSEVFLPQKGEHIDSLIDTCAGYRFFLNKDFGMTLEELDQILDSVTSSGACADGRCQI